MGGKTSVSEKGQAHLQTCLEYKEGEEGVYFCDGTCSSGRTVWGSSPYTADSCVCRAARHCGAIPKTGGSFRVSKAPGCSAYTGSEKNGIQTYEFKDYPTSIEISAAK